MSNDVPIKPLEYKVLIEVKPVNEKSAGGIFLTESSIDKQQHAREVGTVVSVGSLAFTDPDWKECPDIGDSVLFNRYAGSIIRHQGKVYRLVNDKDLGAIVTSRFEEEIK